MKILNRLNIYKLNKYTIRTFCVSELKEKLIKKSLINVNKYGWTDLSIKTAANELGYSHTISTILEKGPMDLIYYTIDDWNEKLKIDVDSLKNQNTNNIDKQIKKAIKLRLSYELPVINTWSQVKYKY
jgi:rpsU-divergently transcribed protein